MVLIALAKKRPLLPFWKAPRPIGDEQCGGFTTSSHDNSMAFGC